MSSPTYEIMIYFKLSIWCLTKQFCDNVCVISINDDSHKISHTVTVAHHGQSLHGMLTLSSIAKYRGKDARAELREKVSNIPISGNVETSFRAEMKLSNSEFGSEINNHLFLGCLPAAVSCVTLILTPLSTQYKNTSK